MYGARSPRVKGEETVQLESSSEGLAGQEDGGHHQEVERGDAAQH